MKLNGLFFVAPESSRAWKVECLMLGGDVTRSWEIDRLSEECGLRCADILENGM